MCEIAACIVRAKIDVRLAIAHNRVVLAAVSVPESVASGADPAGVDGEVRHQLCAERLDQVDVPG